MKRSVLLVIGDHLLASAISRVAAQHFTVRVAPSFEGAHVWLALEPFDVVVSDVALPDGIDARTILECTRVAQPAARRVLLGGATKEGSGEIVVGLAHEHLPRYAPLSEVLATLRQLAAA